MYYVPLCAHTHTYIYIYIHTHSVHTFLPISLLVHLKLLLEIASTMAPLEDLETLKALQAFLHYYPFRLHELSLRRGEASFGFH